MDRPRPESDAALSPRNGDESAAVQEPELGADHPLRAYRRKHGLTQDQIAKRADTTKATVSRIEAGTFDPTFDLMRRLIAATNGAVTADACIAWQGHLRREAAA